jgi:iron complex outermembrane receptor protein
MSGEPRGHSPRPGGRRAPANQYRSPANRSERRIAESTSPVGHRPPAGSDIPARSAYRRPGTERSDRPRWRGTDVSGTFDVAGFYNDFKDQQIAIGLLACSSISLPQCPFIPASAAGIANVGKSTIKGAELEASLTFFNVFRLEGGYSYLDSKIKSIAAVTVPLGFTTAFPPVAGGPISLTPKNQYTITGTYTLPLDPSLGRLSIAMTYSHRDSAFGSTSSKPAQQTLPPENLLNANVNWNGVNGMPLDLSLFVTNLAKAHFYTFTTGASFGFDSYIANQPRMFGFRAKVHFGR